MTQHILAPLDGAALAPAVVPHVAALARIYGADVTLLQIVAPTELRQTPGWGPVPAPILKLSAS
jgi:nucleotide-binding universal stress UspA family protein